MYCYFPIFLCGRSLLYFVKYVFVLFVSVLFGFMKSAEYIVYLTYIYRVSIVYLSYIYRVSIVFVGFKWVTEGLQRCCHLRGRVW